MRNKINTAIVVGAGAWGGWTAYMLQKQGIQVTLLDQLGPGNERSGSGGQTRVIRMAYGGNQLYTDLTGRAFALWKDYERQWNTQFYHKTGSLWMFRDIDPAYARYSQPLLQDRGLSLDELPLEEAKTRFPQVNFNDITSTFFEPESGYLEASRACKVVKEQFERIGGTYRNEKVMTIKGEGDIPALVMEGGEWLKADAYVLACGPWTPRLLPAIEQFLKVSRQEVYFFQSPKKHDLQHLPIWIEFREGEHMYYGIPGDEKTGFKMAYDERTWPLDPDYDDRGVTPEILDSMKPILDNRFPAMKDAVLLKHHTCVYESSIDGDFIIDQIPGSDNAWVLCGSSGHGFKMGPAIGEMMAAAMVNSQALPELFSLKRFEGGLRHKTQYQVSAES